MTVQRKVGRLMISLAVFMLMGMISVPVGSASAPASVKQTSVDIEEKWGIQIIALRLTAAGRMLDFRYKVIDPKKAAFMLDRKNKAHLIDQKTNLSVGVTDVPKIGKLRQNTPTPETGRIYFILFPNPGIIQADSQVTLIVGDLRAENLIVED